MKVAVGGPPNSGKSTFTAALIELVEMHAGQYDWFDVSEFKWLSLDVTDRAVPWLLGEVDERKPDDAEWTTEAANEKRKEFDECNQDLVIADAPGRITDELTIVLRPADRMITLANQESEGEFSNWADVADELDIVVFIEFTTILDEHAPPDYTTEYAGDEAYYDIDEGSGLLKDLSRDAYSSERTHALPAPTRRVIRRIGQDLLQLAVS